MSFIEIYSLLADLVRFVLTNFFSFVLAKEFGFSFKIPISSTSFMLPNDMLLDLMLAFFSAI